MMTTNDSLINIPFFISENFAAMWRNCEEKVANYCIWRIIKGPTVNMILKKSSLHRS